MRRRGRDIVLMMASEQRYSIVEPLTIGVTAHYCDSSDDGLFVGDDTRESTAPRTVF